MNADKTKFLQICASHDDLFALDEEGDVHQYNFNSKSWLKLVSSRDHVTGTGGEPGAEHGARPSPAITNPRGGTEAVAAPAVNGADRHDRRHGS